MVMTAWAVSGRFVKGVKVAVLTKPAAPAVTLKVPAFVFAVKAGVAACPLAPVGTTQVVPEHAPVKVAEAPPVRLWIVNVMAKPPTAPPF